MSRKTHPTSHRLGITMWWPSRSPIASRSPRAGNRTVEGRGGKITELLRGILMKYGYKVAIPSIMTTATSTGRIVIVVRREPERMVSKKLKGAGNAITKKERTIQWKRVVRQATAIPTYVLSYISAMIAEYEKKNYKIEIREIQDENTQGTAEQIAQKITNSEKSVMPTMLEIQRRVTKSQAYVEQQQANISRKDRV